MNHITITIINTLIISGMAIAVSLMIEMRVFKKIFEFIKNFINLKPKTEDENTDDLSQDEKAEISEPKSIREIIRTRRFWIVTAEGFIAYEILFWILRHHYITKAFEYLKGLLPF